MLGALPPASPCRLRMTSRPSGSTFESMGDDAARILIVAYRTAATQALYNAVRDRAKAGACDFMLLVPQPERDHDHEDAELALELALPFLERAARAPIAGAIGPNDPLAAVREMHEREHFHAVIVSTLPVHLSKWLHRDLPHRITHDLGLPVTVISAPNVRHRDATPARVG